MANRPVATLLLLFAAALTACRGSSSDEENVSVAKEAYTSGPAELAQCTAPVLGGTTVTITGKASYHARQIFDNGNGNRGLGKAPGKIFPIRFAEIQVLQPDGNVVQCAQTDNTGHFSFVLPKSATIYTIHVLSRSPAQDTHVKASVLNRPGQNKLYSIQTSVTATANADVGLIDLSEHVDAPVTGEVVGGAFNIFDQILRANEFLRGTAGSCSQEFNDCADFVVAPKVTVYWMKGFDPGTYFGDSIPVSFYLPSFGRLFILGGSRGDVDSTDTDHFDNSVILHEYGHFLEDNVFKTSSPGGPHSGDGVVDPRLAWSEGWGDFIQAAVLGAPTYQDTFGNADGTTGFSYNADLETPHAGNDMPTQDGEGNFREFSIARWLWDVLDNTPSESRFGFVDNVQGRFVEIWAALNREHHGFRDPNFGFLNVGLLHLSQEFGQTNDPFHNGLDFTQVRGMERQRGDTTDYGQFVSAGTCTPYSLTPYLNPTDDGSFETSDLLRNNKFYYLKVDAPISGSLDLTYQDTDGVGTEADLDLFLYDEDARFGHKADFVGVSGRNPDGNPATPESESIALNNLSPGKYLINVHVHTADGVGGAVQYQLKLNGSNLCPAPL